jgi:hypothetical protein
MKISDDLAGRVDAASSGSTSAAGAIDRCENITPSSYWSRNGKAKEC